MAKDNSNEFDKIMSLPFMQGNSMDDALGLVPMTQNKMAVPVRDDGNDYETARTEIHGAMGTLKTAIDEMATLAFSAQHSRAYEVLGGLVEKMVLASEKLVDLQNKSNQDTGPKTINNTLMISSSEMLDMMKKRLEGNG
jgi:hypothetical protein